MENKEHIESVYERMRLERKDPEAALVIQDLYHQLRDKESKLAAMESQLKRAEQHLDCYRSVCGSLPADKPAVAVPDGFNIERQDNHIVVTGPDKGQGVAYADETLYQLITAILAAAPSHSQQSAHTVPAEAYEQATEAINNIYGASQHCDCHSFEIAKQWRDETHGGTIYDRCPSHESEQTNSWLVDQAQKAKEQTKDWPEWRKDAVINSDAYAVNQQTEGE